MLVYVFDDMVVDDVVTGGNVIGSMVVYSSTYCWDNGIAADVGDDGVYGCDGVGVGELCVVGVDGVAVIDMLYWYWRCVYCQ